MSSPLESRDRDALLDEILDEAAEGARRGKPERLEDWIERYPELEGALRELLPALLRLEDGASGAMSGATTQELPALSQVVVEPGFVLGDYRLIRELGRGGMGVVYEAEQQSLGRPVAIKLLPGTAGDVASMRRRFELEARTAARLHHPHIVSIHDFGEANGFVFYAMQLVAGSNLDAIVSALRRRPARPSARDGRDTSDLVSALAQALRSGAIDGHSRRDGSSSDAALRQDDSGSGTAESTPTPAEPIAIAALDPASARGDPAPKDGVDAESDAYFRSVARIGSIVADALAHAHAAGVVHRDIKPSNLLLDRRGKVWVADFGLAKLEAGEGLTRSGDAVGTLRYMGPERFRGRSGPQSDIYSLGATLYELATLRPPFVARDRASLVRQILIDDPIAPRRAEPRVPRDLETVILRCLEKEPAQRYANADELRDDLERFLDGRPVLARRTSTLERAWLFARRNPLIAGLAVAFAVIAVIATAIALRLEITAQDLEETAIDLEAERNRALDNLYGAWLERARALQSDPDPELRAEVLRSIAEAARYRPSRELRNVAIPWIGSLGLRIEREIETGGHAAISPAGDRIAVADPEGGGIEIRDLDAAVLRKIDACWPTETHELDYSPDGRYLIRTNFEHRRHEILRVDEGSCAVVVPSGALSFHPREPLVAVTWRTPGGATFEIRDLSNGKQVAAPDWAKGARGIFWGPSGARAARIAADGKSVTIVETENGRKLRRFVRPESRFNDPIDIAVWHPEGRLVAVGWRPLVVWDVEFGGALLELPDVFLRKIAFSPDGEYLAVRSWGGSEISRLYESRGVRFLAKVHGDFEGFRADSQALWIRQGSAMAIAAIERSASHRVVAFGDDSSGTRNPMAIDASGRWLAVARDDAVVIEDLARERRVARIDGGGVNWLTWKSGPTELLTAGPAGVWRWPWRESEEAIAVGPPIPIERRGVTGGFALGPGGRVAYFVGGVANVRHIDSPERDFTLAGFASASEPCISADGRYLAAADNLAGRELRVWDLESRETAWQQVDPGATRAIFVGADRLLLVRRNELHVVEPATWRIIGEPIPGDDAVPSPGGELLAVRVPATRSIRLFAVGTPLEPLSTIGSRDAIGSAAIGPDGRQLVVGSAQGGPVDIWRLDALRSRLRELDLDWDPPLSVDPAEPGGAAAVAVTVDVGELSSPALADFERAERDLEANPKDTGARWRRAHAAAELGRWEQAFADGEAALAAGFNVEVANALAWWYATAPSEHRDPERAVELSRRVTEAEPRQATYWNTLGVAECRRRAWREAIEALEKSLESSRGTFEAAFDHYPLAIALQGLGDARAARLAFEIARRDLELEPEVRGDLLEKLLDELRVFDREAAAAIGDASPLPIELEESQP